MQGNLAYAFTLLQNLALVQRVYLDTAAAYHMTTLQFLLCAKDICSPLQCQFLEEMFMHSSGWIKLNGDLFLFRDGTLCGVRLKPCPLEVCYVDANNFATVYDLFCIHRDPEEALVQTYQNIIELKEKVQAAQTKLAELNFQIITLDHQRFKKLKGRDKLINQVKRESRRKERQLRRLFAHQHRL